MADPTAKDGGGRVGDTELSVRSNERQATGVHKLNLPIMNQETVVSVDGGSHTTRVRTPGPNVDMPFAMPPKNNNRLSVVNAGDPTKSLSRVPSSDTLEEEDEKENLRDNVSIDALSHDACIADGHPVILSGTKAAVLAVLI